LTSTPQPDTTAHPAPADLTGQELEETIKLAHEWGALKQIPRTGWTRAGVQQPESVAAHTARTAMLAWIIAGLEGVNQDRAATLALFHDSQESRTGDLDHVGRNYLQPVGNEQITSDQAAALPQLLAAALRRLVDEYEGRASREAECARDAGGRLAEPGPVHPDRRHGAAHSLGAAAGGGRDARLAGGLVAGLRPRRAEDQSGKPQRRVSAQGTARGR
jgi:hypothetical protein